MAGNVTERSIKLNVTAEADPSMLSNLDRFAKQAEERISLRKPDPIIEAFTPNWREKAMTQELLRLAEEADAEAAKSHANRIAMIREEHSLFKQAEEEKRQEEAKRLQDADAEHDRRIAMILQERESFKQSEEERKRQERQFLDESRRWNEEAAAHRLEVARRLDSSFGRTTTRPTMAQFGAVQSSLAAESAAQEAAAQAKIAEAEQKRIANAQTLSRLEEAMHNDRRRAMSTEDRINDDHEQRVATIRRELNLTQQQTDELIRQSGLIRDQALVRNQRTIEFERRNAALHAAGQNARLGPMFQEAGRGLEDFIVGFSMAKTSAEGMALGLRGAANNAGQLAAISGSVYAPYVAIGAALSTIIVPKMMEWLTATEDLEERTKSFVEWMKRSGKEARDKQGDVFLFAGMNSSEDLEKEIASRRKAVSQSDAELRMLRGQKKKEVEDFNEIVESNIKKTIGAKSMARAAAVNPLAALLMGGSILSSESKAESTREAEDRINAINSRIEEVQKERLAESKKLQRAISANEDVAQREREEKHRKGFELFTKQRIESEELASKLESDLIDDELKARNEKRTRFENEFYNNKSKIDELSELDKQKREELHAKNMQAFNARIDRMQREENRDAALKAIDDQIEAQQSKLEGLQDRQVNPNGPSSHAFFGSQTTASIINRAISGSATVEDTLKAQLKVEKEQLKELQRQKKAMTIRI